MIFGRPYYRLGFLYEILLMFVKQASVGGQQEVDEQIASLLLRAISDNNDDDADIKSADAALGRNTSWYSTVDHTPSPSTVGYYQSGYESTLPTTVDITVSADTASSALRILRGRRTRHPHSKAAVGLMKAWYDQHRSRPYASDAEVRRLAMECQLRVRQVQKWLSNQRRMDGNTRRRNRPAHNAKSTTSTAIGAPSMPCSD